MVGDDGQIMKVPFDEFRASQKSVIEEANPEFLLKNRDEDIKID